MIKDTLRNAIRSLSKKYGIGEKELRIKISKSLDEKGNYYLKSEIMKNKDELDVTNVATALNLNTIMAFMVGNRLNTILDSLSKEHGISEETLNVRIYTKDEESCDPMLYLFDDKTPIVALDIDKFI